MINISEFLILSETDSKTIYIPTLKRLGYARSMHPKGGYDKTVETNDLHGDYCMLFRSKAYLYGGSATNDKEAFGLRQNHVVIVLNVVQSARSRKKINDFYIDFLKKSVHKYFPSRVFDEYNLIGGYVMVIVPRDKAEFLSMLTKIEKHFRDVLVLNSKVSGRGKRYKKI